MPEPQGEEQHGDPNYWCEKCSKTRCIQWVRFPEDVDRGEVTHENCGYQEREDQPDGTGEDMDGIGHDLAAAVGEDVEDFQPFHGPEGRGCADDEQAAEKKHLADGKDGDIHDFIDRPVDFDQAEPIEEDDQAFGYLSQSTQDEARSQDLQGDVYRA